MKFFYLFFFYKFSYFSIDNMIKIRKNEIGGYIRNNVKLEKGIESKKKMKDGRKKKGEKKRNEIFQMAMMEPKLSILDETDSGLDIDALKIVANGVNSLKSSSNSIILITHYQRLLNYIVPDFVHILKDGKIVMSGDKSLAQKLEKEGYSFLN